MTIFYTASVQTIKNGKLLRQVDSIEPRLSGCVNRNHHLSEAPLRGGCTPTPNGVGPNRPHLSFCSEPFGLEQRTLGIASVPQGTKQFIALNGERACSARQAETRQQQQQQEPPFFLLYATTLPNTVTAFKVH